MKIRRCAIVTTSFDFRGKRTMHCRRASVVGAVA
jgi:hypothetical protein